ncbi:YolD-like family protein [Paenibacillaceae bacterium]|nr:YolD-like family protein [Paenibacillaceae bacterium]
MSKKLTGNGLWESSRMMLPEHKERINESQENHKKRSKPIIHEDEWEIILRSISDSYLEGFGIEVNLFTLYGDRMISGTVSQISSHSKKFRINFSEGYEWVDFTEVTGARLI